MPPKSQNPMDAILERIDTLEEKLVKEQEKATTCVGDACKVLDDKISKKLGELDALKQEYSKMVAEMDKKLAASNTAATAELDKKIDACVGKHCELIRKDIAGVKLKAMEQPPEGEEGATKIKKEDDNTMECPTCNLPIEIGKVGTKTTCPHCRDVIEWKPAE